MATQAQIEANRANARKSTGPKTEAGKRNSSKNALLHGLSALEAVVFHGEEEAYQALRDGIIQEHKPTSSTEQTLVENIIHAAWTLHRCRRAEVVCFENTSDGTVDPLLCRSADDSVRAIDRYFRRAESALHRSLRTLRELRQERRDQEAAEAAANPMPREPIEVIWVGARESGETKPIDTQPDPVPPPPAPQPQPRRARTKRTQFPPTKRGRRHARQ